MKYSPKCISGAGLFDGEGTERLWSYLGKFNKITKEQTYENRQDLLCEALLNVGAKLGEKITANFAQRYQRATMLKESCMKTLEEDIKLTQGIQNKLCSDFVQIVLTKLSLIVVRCELITSALNSAYATDDCLIMTFMIELAARQWENVTQKLCHVIYCNVNIVYCMVKYLVIISN